MKWHMILGALVMSVSLSTQSFGFELLDTLLGMNSGCGCAAPTSCCEKPCGDVGCCAKRSRCCKPACCAPACEATCAAAPACAVACDSAPSCGCAAQSCGSCCKSRCHHHRRGCNSGCGSSCGCAAPACEATCDSAPSCGCAAPSCGSCCKKTRCCRPCLLDLFRCRKSCCNTCSTGCSTCAAEASCGCGAGAHSDGAVIEGDAAPVPPAPMADPSASYQGQRNVIQATSLYSR
jgi:hypothetical protein